MDDFERRFAATLKEITHQLPQGPEADPTLRGTRRPARHRVSAPLVAAATVAAIVGVGAWQGGLARSGTQEVDLAPAGPSVASPWSPTDAALPASRAAIIDTAEQLSEFSTRHGFGEVDVDYQSATVTVLWSGSPPAEVTALAGRRADGVLVALESAPFSQADLTDAAAAISRVASERFGQDAITEVYPEDDLSGLVVEATSSQVRAEALTRATDGIPVTVHLVEIGTVTCAYGEECDVRNDDGTTAIPEG
jgi:hypothetical protein